jgi:hypothetical protein
VGQAQKGILRTLGNTLSVEAFETREVEPGKGRCHHRHLLARTPPSTQQRELDMGMLEE